MSAGSITSVVLTLALVLGVMGIALRLLRKYTMGTNSQRGTIPMEVVQRMGLGQRQGIAVVRIGVRLFAVSMGDGGVRYLTELHASDVLESGDTAKTKAGDTPGGYMSAVTSMFAPAAYTGDTSRRNTALTNASNRISYVAPLEDFQAVLSMAMNGPSHL